MDAGAQASGPKRRKKSNKQNVPVSPKLSPPCIFTTFRRNPDPVKIREQEDELQKAAQQFAVQEAKKEKLHKMKTALQPDVQVRFGLIKTPQPPFVSLKPSKEKR